MHDVRVRHTLFCIRHNGPHEAYVFEYSSVLCIPDPRALQDFFCPSSKGWPPFLRVNPVLNWAYSDVWAHLRAIEAAYCSLYLEGYTSLGSTKDTTPNSSLRRSDGSFAPAYMLNGVFLLHDRPACVVRVTTPVWFEVPRRDAGLVLACPCTTLPAMKLRAFSFSLFFLQACTCKCKCKQFTSHIHIGL